MLALSTSGDFLQDVYLQVRRGLVMAEQGGGVATVKEVSIVRGERESLSGDVSSDRQAFAYRCRWNVAGTVEHWGHIHQRTNQYEAELTVRPVEGAWKITGLELLQEKRVN